jgi:polysaccharide biosynthesis protein PslH
MTRPTLLFISPRFLLPVDSGGKIRTTQTLRGMKGGRFDIRLLSPATPELVERYRSELDALCDDFQWWPQGSTGPSTRLTRLRHVFNRLPVPIASDYHPDAVDLIRRELAGDCAAVVFDFLHSVVLAPPSIAKPSVLFTHNVEAEIFARHVERAGPGPMRALWKNQFEKMRAFERSALHRFDVVVAVSERDAGKFRSDHGLAQAFVIPTGVDLDFFAFAPPERDFDIVFCGSMDWLANQDAMRFFLEEIWPLILREAPQARMTVVGRTPPEWLVNAARRYGAAWTFTGFVDDVRPYMRGAAVSVIPMRIGGGTRLKAYESMATGNVIVSTSIGVEGLPVVSGQHCEIADDAAAFAAAIVVLMRDRARRHAMAVAAREYVQENFGYRVAAEAFERACLLAIERRSAAATRERAEVAS